MPYKLKDDGWMAQVRVNGKKYQKRCATKEEATFYEATFDIGAKAFRTNERREKKIKPQNLMDIKVLCHALYADPNMTVGDIFDFAMIVIDIPVRYKDVYDLAKEVVLNKQPQMSPRLRMDILQRDGFACVLCGRKPPEVELHVDHIVPRIKGGMTEDRNLRTLCRDCNLGKGHGLIGIIPLQPRDVKPTAYSRSLFTGAK